MSIPGKDDRRTPWLRLTVPLTKSLVACDLQAVIDPAGVQIEASITTALPGRKQVNLSKKSLTRSKVIPIDYPVH